MSDKKITVLKFGGSVLRDENDLPLAVHEIYRHWRKGQQVLAVVSAFGGTTDSLIEKAKKFGDDPHPEAFATLLLTGEATSAAMLGLALKRAGVPAKILTPEQVGILTTGDPLDSQPIAANTGRIAEELEHAVVIVSGFAGINRFGDPTLLGRGGTDYTALFLARRLNGNCILLKDVDGLYDLNPAVHGKRARRYVRASYATTLKLGGELVQSKAVHFAEESSLTFEIAGLARSYSTLVAPCHDLLDGNVTTAQRPIRVALLGCGTVGGGVYERLAAMPDRFDIVGVSTLHSRKALAFGVDREHLAPDAYELINREADVVIELIGGLEPARDLIKKALRLGRHVITANKALLSTDDRSFEHLARQSGVTIRYSAAVGGALPALEIVHQAARTGRPTAIQGIINGTSNFICDQLASGIDFETALKEARSQGFAEADPSLDLDGTDAAQKLVLLARATFGIDLSFAAVKREGIRSLKPERIRQALRNGNLFRLIAECTRTPHGLDAWVRPVEISANHRFAKIEGPDNCLLIESENGLPKFLKGRGAGRYATTESVIADLFDLRSALSDLRTSGPLAKFKEAAA